MADRLNAAPRLGHVTVDGYTGWAMVAPGHNLPADTVERIARDGFSREGVVRSGEAHWWEQKRVKWCGNYGDACDSEGDWHTHWHALRPSDDPSTHFTVIWIEG